MADHLLLTPIWHIHSHPLHLESISCFCNLKMHHVVVTMDPINVGRLYLLFVHTIPVILIWSFPVKLASEILHYFIAIIYFVAYTMTDYLPGEVEFSHHLHVVITAWLRQFWKVQCTLDRCHFYSGPKRGFYTKEQITNVYLHTPVLAKYEHELQCRVHTLKNYLWS